MLSPSSTLHSRIRRTGIPAEDANSHCLVTQNTGRTRWKRVRTTSLNKITYLQAPNATWSQLRHKSVSVQRQAMATDTPLSKTRRHMQTTKHNDHKRKEKRQKIKGKKDTICHPLRHIIPHPKPTLEDRISEQRPIVRQLFFFFFICSFPSLGNSGQFTRPHGREMWTADSTKGTTDLPACGASTRRRRG